MNLPNKKMSPTTATVLPLAIEKQQLVIEQTHAYINQAVELFNIKNKAVDIHFNLKGRAAGMYRISQRNRWHFSRSKREIRYNSFIFSKYYEDNFNTTIPHEVAHYVSDVLYGLNNIKPHGKEWKAIMQAFGANPSVTANYDLSGIPLKKQTRFSYQCGCKEHQLSTIRHNKINYQGYRYYCKYCKQILLPDPQEKPRPSL